MSGFYTTVNHFAETVRHEVIKPSQMRHPPILKERGYFVKRDALERLGDILDVV